MVGAALLVLVLSLSSSFWLLLFLLRLPLLLLLFLSLFLFLFLFLSSASLSQSFRACSKVLRLDGGLCVGLVGPVPAHVDCTGGAVSEIALSVYDYKLPKT